MRLSKAYIPTQKEIPADAKIPSHKLMIRAGLIRQLVSGVYSYLPLGWKIMKKVMEIIREEMDAIGAQELYLPVLNPVEIWEESGRNKDFGDEMFRLKDRKKRSLVMAPTHEEVVCDLARKFVKSYKDLPQIWYQIQTKFRDEPRPRSGVMRTRQFIMKDSYTLDADEKGLDRAYNLHAKAYRNIFSRCGLKFHVVGAYSGLMGGSKSQEFMIESESGEDTLILCTKCDYASNMDVAESVAEKASDDEIRELKKIHTPNRRTIDEVSDFLNIPPKRLMKSLLYISEKGPLMLLIRGDHEVNESKLHTLLGGDFRSAEKEEIRDICGVDAGFMGPINLRKKIRIIADISLKEEHNLTTGANENDYHFTGIEINRDFSIDDFVDIRNVESGDRCIVCGEKLRIVNAIELGHIFKLGTKYSESMKAYFLDKDGTERPIYMGSYGIGVERIVAASIEQNHRDNGIAWHPSIAPYLIHIIPINFQDDKIRGISEQIYDLLWNQKIDTILDDRNASPGVKFKDADLLGMPLQVIIGEKWIKSGKIEIKKRSNDEVIYSSKTKFLEDVVKIINSLKS